MSSDKVVELERTRDPDGQQGSFGFSILGGYGTKFPACVCEVDQGGPADLTNRVRGEGRGGREWRGKEGEREMEREGRGEEGRGGRRGFIWREGGEGVE